MRSPCDLTSIAQIKDNLENRFGEADIQFMDEITHLHLGGKLETTLKHIDWTLRTKSFKNAI